MKVVLSNEARDDLVAIGRYIARDNPSRGESFVEELLDRCTSIGEAPEAFQLVARYTARGIRRRVYRNYLIFYRIADSRVEIVRVLHGAQDYERILFPDEWN